MKSGKWILVLFLLGSGVTNTTAQKKWDGQGSDGNWSNDRNWYPDGVPLLSDDVLINNEYVAGSYKIAFPSGMYATSIHSLSILPKFENSIVVELPVGNTASPCLTISSAGNAFKIGKGGLFINGSGANAGNAMVLIGKLLIENGGRYVHRTLRGNAAIVSKLSVDTSTQHGIFEFDVPGNAGYTLSLSGRQFGTLCLSALTAGKKSYSGSGASALQIHGDLRIEDSASLTSTLNSTVNIGRDLNVKGMLLLNPALADTLSNELHFNGDTTSMEISGTIGFGSNFRNIVVGRGQLKLKTNMAFTNPNLMWKISALASMMMDDFSLGGQGSLVTDSASTLGIGSQAGISSDRSKGNIRLQNLFFHPKTNYVFYGPGEQQTGDRFPAEAASITINKVNGDVRINSTLRITDSLGLIRGNALTDSSRILTFSGNRISARQQGFVNGPFRYTARSKKDMYFPVGGGSIFAPVVISKKKEDSAVFQVEYHPYAPSVGDSVLAFPIRTVSTQEFWDIKKIFPQDTVENQDAIRLWLGPNSIAGIIGQPLMARRIAGEKTWELLPLYASNTYPNTLASIPAFMKSGSYTFGSMYPAALSMEILELCYQERNGFTKFSWITNNDENADRYVLEKSSGSGQYISVDSVFSKNKTGKTGYSNTFRSSSINGNFIRVRAVGKNGRSMFSNIIFVRRWAEEIRIYPNPANDFISIGPLLQAWSLVGILNQAGQIIETISNPIESGSFINISRLPAGKYTFMLSEGGRSMLLPFMKQ